MDPSAQPLRGATENDTGDVMVEMQEFQPGGEPLRQPEAKPPTYTVKSDQPPSYDSLFARVQSVKDNSSGNVDFAQRLVAVTFCGTICQIISLIVFATIPIINIVIGLAYFKQCQVQTYIPIYLIVAGAVGLLKAIIQAGLLVLKCKDRNEVQEEAKAERANPLDLILNCFLFAWFIAGSVWVYSVYDDVQHTAKGEDDYCARACYWYMFWFITITYIFVGLGLMCCCGLSLVGCLVACKKPEQ